MEEIAKFFDGDDAVDVGEVAFANMKERGLETSGMGEKDLSVTRVEAVSRA
jgi:hypothetical protein